MGLPEDPTQVIRKNLVRNPRLATAGVWSVTGGTPTYNSTDVSAPVGLPAGAKVLKFVSTGGNGFLSQAYPNTEPATPGQVMWPSIYVQAALANAANKTAFAEALPYNSSGVQLSEAVGGSATVTRGAGWSRVAGSVALPASTAYVGWRFYAGTSLTAGDTFYFCAPLGETGVSSTGYYFDGSDNSNLNGDDPSWLGTADASVSQIEVGLFVLGGSA